MPTQSALTPTITPTTVSAATRAAIAIAQTLPGDGDRWLGAVHATARALIHRVADSHGLPLDENELPYTRVPDAEDALDTIGPFTGWTPLTIGDIHQELLPLHLKETAAGLEAVRPTGATLRDLQGSWYTPQPLAQATTRLALEAAIGQMPADEPDQVLRLRAVDPACGAGVFLVEGARMIASVYARRLAGTVEAPRHLLRKILPEVIYQCVYGMDIDPVAVDLARMSLWLEVEGQPPFGWLDGNIACLNPFDAPNSLPSRLLHAMGEEPLQTPAT